MEMRLQKVLAAAGVGSRRRCEALIASGRVCVDGRVISELGTKVDPDTAVITVDGQPLGGSQEKVYILLNKPTGYTSTRSDPHAKHTVLELVRGVDVFLFPVGRLDVDTSGLMILTNDGELAQQLTHPSHEVEKTYLAEVRGAISARGVSRLEQGIELDDGMTAPAKARLISWSRKDDASTVEITVREGRKRQVRRMLDTVGHRVLKLKRIRMGNLELGGLKEGAWRHLTKKEVARLKNPATRKEQDQ
jgi:23S rRNA pseudouridine2605 synthase